MCDPEGVRVSRLGRGETMRRPSSLTDQPNPAATPKASVGELAVLLVLCLLAGVGAGMAFASALIGLAVAGIGLIAIAAYALATDIASEPRRPREESRRLTVSDISARRRWAPRPVDSPRETSGPERTPEPDEAPDAAPIVATTAQPDRVVPFRTPSVRL
jgi:hypothetical protein